MQHFGYKPAMLVLLLVLGLSTGCSAKEYNADEMAKLSTLSRTTMDIVDGYYYGKPLPASISESEIVEIVKSRGRAFDELKLIEGEYELRMVSDGQHLGAVSWDSKHDRKLIQDLQCTTITDDEPWKKEVHGNEFTLTWEACK